VPVIAGVMAWCPAQSAAQLTVFDPANFQQNLLSAARALEQINNQVLTLQNQALMIARMDLNLKRLGPTLSSDLQRTLSALQSQLTAGEGIALRLSTTQSAYEQLFPKQASAALTSDDALRNAKVRWDEAYAVFQRAALVQGQVADGISTDTSLLAAALGRSRDAVGALEAVQAGNELTALNVKQALALQALLAAQHRAETTARASGLAAEEEARQRFKTFLGSGKAYAASK
jgi:P-type conjugative transfer protein TrbJ